MCTESPLDPFPPSDILGHDLDWLASTAKKGRERDLANELPVGEAKRESSKQDKCRQKKKKTVAGEGDVARLHQGGENKSHLVVYTSQTVRFINRMLNCEHNLQFFTTQVWQKHMPGLKEFFCDGLC